MSDMIIMELIMLITGILLRLYAAVGSFHESTLSAMFAVLLKTIARLLGDFLIFGAIVWWVIMGA